MKEEQEEVKTGSEAHIQEQCLVIPANHVVCKVDLDAEEPYCEILEKNFTDPYATKKVLIPNALAYYMTTHFIGSQKAVNRIANNARRSVQQEIQAAMGLGG